MIGANTRGSGCVSKPDKHGLCDAETPRACDVGQRRNHALAGRLAAGSNLTLSGIARLCRRIPSNAPRQCPARP